MASPKFYFYPVAGGLLQTIDFTGLTLNVTDFDDSPLIDSTGATSQTGRDYSVVRRSAPRLRIYFNRLPLYTTQGNLVERHLRLLVDHLDRGGVCAFALDQDKAWSAFSVGDLEQTEDDIQTREEIFGGALESSPLPVSGDKIWVHGAYPQRRRELVAATGYASGTQTLALNAGLRTDHTGPALLHTRDFWPMMIRPQGDRGRAALTTERGRFFSLDITLEMDTGRMDVLAESSATGGENFGSPTDPGDIDFETIPTGTRYQTGGLG